jgi:tetratricopeptide (TPR) repeat protein
MRTINALVVGVGLLAAAPLSAQDWKGTGRLSGSVTDTDGKPLAGATVKLELPERGGGTTLTTNNKGRWALLGVAAGAWNIDVSLDGYASKALSVTLPAESVRLPPIEVQLEKAGPAGPSPELAKLAAAADAAYKAGRFAEARAEYEKLLAARPDLAPTIHQQIGFSYVQEQQFDKAVEHLEQVLAAEPGNAQVRAIAAQAALEGGQLDKARALLAGLDETKVTNPDAFFNLGIDFFNAGQSKEAVEYLDKAIELDPASVDAYYRRALAHLGLGHTAEARADFQKVIELQPDGEMATMSKKALEQLK